MCVPRDSLNRIANESNTMSVRITLFPTRGCRVCSSRYSHWPASFKNLIRFLAVQCGVVSFVVYYVVLRDPLNGDKPISTIRMNHFYVTIYLNRISPPLLLRLR